MLAARTDVVGSLLRPPELLEALARHERGELDDAAFKRIEDAAVDGALALQADAGLEVVTDGELRRLSFQSQLPASTDGFSEWSLDAFLWGEWHDAKGTFRKERPGTLGATGKLARKRYLSADEFTFLKNNTSRIAKVTLPSPSLWANFWSRERSSAAYPTLDSFLADVVEILRQEVQELVRLGATYIQIDAPHYGLMLDEKTRRFYEEQGWSLNQWFTRGVELDNAIIAGFSGVTFALHL